MIFAEFYAYDLAGKLDHATGDRSLVILDGRSTAPTWHAIASHECSARGYAAYVLRKGRGFTDSKAISARIFPTQCGVPQS